MDFSCIEKQKTFYKFKFDFEVGLLVKSPCRECELNQDMPKCFETCEVIDRIQSVLAEGRSCSRG